MLGQTIEAKSPLPIGAILWLTAAGAGGVAGLVSGNAHFLMAALLPLMLAVVLGWRHPKGVVVTLHETGIVTLDNQQAISYESMQAIAIGDKLLKAYPRTLMEASSGRESRHHKTVLGRAVNTKPDSIAPGPIAVLHAGGYLFLPEKMNVSSVELGKFLVGRLPQMPEKEVHPSLADYAQEQLAKFGPDKVVCIHQRDSSHQSQPKNNTSVFGLALLYSGIVWFVSSIVLMNGDNQKTVEAFSAWLGVAILSIILGFLFWLARRRKSDSKLIDPISNGRACIVLGPAGLGLAQGKLKGKLRWEEITGIKNGPEKKFGRAGQNALQLSIIGGEIAILDVYDRSLTDVASLITKNTRKPAG